MTDGDNEIKEGQKWFDGIDPFKVVKVREGEIEVKYHDDPPGVHSWHHPDRFEEFERA